MKNKKGFTLVEILIVVVILGILAAIVIPQFTNASTSAKLSSVLSDLQMFRSQIELYKLQHNEAKPSLALVSFGGEQVNGLTGVTLVDGTQVDAGTANSYGKYMQKVPTNPFNNSNTIALNVAAGTADLTTIGWVFDTTTGAFYPNFIDLNGDGDCSDTDETPTDY